MLVVSSRAGIFYLAITLQNNKARLTQFKYLDFSEQIAKANLHLPLDGALLSVQITELYSPVLLQLFVGCFNYHHFLVAFDALASSLHIELVLMRYGDYWATPQIVVKDSFALVRYVSSPFRADEGRSQQVVALYDINTTGLARQETRYLVGLGLAHSDPVSLHLGLSFRRKESGRSVYLLRPGSRAVQEYRFSEELQVRVTDSRTPSQWLQLTARNDYGSYPVRLHLSLFTNAWPFWAYLVLFSGLGLTAAVGFLVYRGIKSHRRKAQVDDLIEDSEGSAEGAPADDLVAPLLQQELEAQEHGASEREKEEDYDEWAD